MLILRTSPLTGKSNTMDLDITEDQVWQYRNGALLQQAFPNLTAHSPFDSLRRPLSHWISTPVLPSGKVVVCVCVHPIKHNGSMINENFLMGFAPH